MVLIVLRHGESVWNKENRFTGLTDVALSENGQKEANETASILSGVPIHTIFCSTLKRTIETAEIVLAKQITCTDIPLIQDSSLCERDYGDLTGKNKTELAELYGETLVKSWRRSYLNGPPNGENLDDVRRRAGLYYDNEISPLLKEDKNVLIVSHGNTLRALFVHLGIKDEQTIESFEIPTGVPIQVDVLNKQFRFEN